MGVGVCVSMCMSVLDILHYLRTDFCVFWNVLLKLMTYFMTLLLADEGAARPRKFQVIKSDSLLFFCFQCFLDIY